MLVVAVISVDAYPFLVFSDLSCHLKDTGIGIFCFYCAAHLFLMNWLKSNLILL